VRLDKGLAKTHRLDVELFSGFGEEQEPLIAVPAVRETRQSQNLAISRCTPNRYAKSQKPSRCKGSGC
jgi:hypothetical protein